MPETRSGTERARSDLSASISVDSDVEIRPLRSQADYWACFELQRETWGEDYGEFVPPRVLQVSQRVGGVAGGAFDRSDRLVGFVFGMTGVRDGRLVHWSDMLAVRPSFQNRGIGRRLKEFQRDRVLELGVEVIYWTFDPLVARNAHLNLNRLGAEIDEYVPDMYGESDSVLHRDLGTDRIIVGWRIEPRGSRSERSPDPARFVTAPIVNLSSDGAPVVLEPGVVLPSDPSIRVAIPLDIHNLGPATPGSPAEWRQSTRSAFLEALDHGYGILGVYSDEASERCYYVFASPGSGERS